MISPNFLAAASVDPNPAFIAPFALLLLSIAMFPVLAAHWWERHYPKVCGALGLFTVAYYVTLQGGVTRIAHTGHEYICFVVLLGALYVVSGGIHLQVPRNTFPRFSAVLLFVGALLANVIGTTGASMLLIRPWMTLNDSRYRPFHTVFFILVVSNCGGCLTPIGDPPLFMGFLRGVPFFWTATIAGLPWILVITFLILAFLGFEAFHRKPETPFHKATGIRVEGLANIGWLLLIIAAIFIPEPIFLREAIMLVAAFGSYFLTPKRLHDLNRFTFAPIKEVAWLFLGIFATMMPALDYLSGHAKGLGLESPTALYWWTGSLSAVLDNAPTYICFLTAAISVQGGSVESAQDVQRFATDHASALGAISLAAVFFGAITYIGNGPNLMVRSVVLHAHKAAPSFFAYTLRYALPLLLPALVLVWWLFVR